MVRGSWFLDGIEFWAANDEHGTMNDERQKKNDERGMMNDGW
jgi:hypothetical protein